MYALVNDFNRGLTKPEHVLHPVAAGRPPDHPTRRSHCALGEDPAIKSPMREGDVLIGPGENQRMLPHHLTAAQNRKADGAGLAWAGMPGAGKLHRRGELLLSPARDRLAEAECGAGGGIHFL